MRKEATQLHNAVWTKAAKDSADPERVRHYLGLLAESGAAAQLKRASAEQAKILASIFAGSQALGSLLAARPAWLEILRTEVLKYPRRKQGLQQEADALLQASLAEGDFAGALARLREFKSREMLRIGARDLARLSASVSAPATVAEIIAEISDLADVCLGIVWTICRRQLIDRYGQPYHLDASGRWHRTEACVLGMGKLGGQELNYSSDVDVLFVYSDEGDVFQEPPSPELRNPEGGLGSQPARRKRAQPSQASSATPRPTLANHQYFNRLAESFIAEVTRLAPEGALYRIDLRLRPEGDLGPLSRSLPGYENYYSQWGQTWERMMLIKARGVAGDQSLAAEFLETVQPFRYPRSINESALAEVGALKDRIENEVVRAEELDLNVKLGRGGIREIEFIAQALQLLHAGRQPFLQSSQTLSALQKLAQYELITTEAARELSDAYCFLRDVEHRLQMENNQQTHSIPVDPKARQRLARLMGFGREPEFEAARRAHTGRVRAIFESILKREAPREQIRSAFPNKFEDAEREWKQVLSEHGFKDVERAFRMLREFVEGPGYVHVSPRTSELALQLLPRMFGLCPATQKSENQRPKAERNPSFEARIRLPEKRAKSFSDFEFRPSDFGFQKRQLDRPAPILSDPDRVVTRLDSFISAYGARATLFELWHSNPSLFDLLLLLFDRSEFLAELAIRTPDLVDELVSSGRLRQRKSAEETLRDLRHGLDDPDQRLWLRRYHQVEVMRIGLRDILGLAPEDQYLTELSALAEACLRYALEAVLRQHRLKSPPLAIIGLGKLGGAEIDYGSDLDLLFVTADKTKNPAKLKVLALELMDLLSTRTAEGRLFHTDARLRPDGEKGLLVNTLSAYEVYYRRRAMLWEIQTLTRARAIAGDPKLGKQFEEMSSWLSNFAKPSRPLAAYTPDWKQRIHEMRLRIEKERTPRGQDELAIKTGAGGLIDAEFIAQALCLQRGWHEPNTLRALERARTEGLLPDADKLIAKYRQLRRVEGILRRWSYEGETVLPDDSAPYHRVAVRCGYETPEQFRQALAEARQVIRQVYLQFFNNQ